MNPHLSSEGIANYLSGNAGRPEFEHLRECTGCSAEVARLESSLALFRDSLRQCSDDCLKAKETEFFIPKANRMEHLFTSNEIWSLYPRQKKSWLLSLAFQTTAVAMMFTVASIPTVRHAARQAFDLYVPLDLSAESPKTQFLQGGGGGGDRSALPPSRGNLPKALLKQFTPPAAVSHNPDPKLTLDPSILAPPDIPLPQVALNELGDPWAKIGPPSNGTGSAGGIGTGTHGGVGPGSGPGPGSGSNGGISGGVYRTGLGVTAPALLYKVEPEYSEEARQAKYQGVVVLRVVVDPAGRVQNPQVIRSLGLGLDEKAIEAVSKWKFRPGFKDGRPVPVIAEIEVSFRLL